MSDDASRGASLGAAASPVAGGPPGSTSSAPPPDGEVPPKRSSIPAPAAVPRPRTNPPPRPSASVPPPGPPRARTSTIPGAASIPPSGPSQPPAAAAAGGTPSRPPPVVAPVAGDIPLPAPLPRLPGMDAMPVGGARPPMPTIPLDDAPIAPPVIPTLGTPVPPATPPAASSEPTSDVARKRSRRTLKIPDDAVARPTSASQPDLARVSSPEISRSADVLPPPRPAFRSSPAVVADEQAIGLIRPMQIVSDLPPVSDVRPAVAAIVDPTSIVAAARGLDIEDARTVELPPPPADAVDDAGWTPAAPVAAFTAKPQHAAVQAEADEAIEEIEPERMSEPEVAAHRPPPPPPARALTAERISEPEPLEDGDLEFGSTADEIPIDFGNTADELPGDAPVAATPGDASRAADAAAAAKLPATAIGDADAAARAASPKKAPPPPPGRRSLSGEHPIPTVAGPVSGPTPAIASPSPPAVAAPAAQTAAPVQPTAAQPAAAQPAAAQPVAAQSAAAAQPAAADARAAAAPPPASGLEPAARRRQKPWWEELFGDDYLRTMDRPEPKFTHREVDFIEESLGVEKGAVILDLACGAGGHAVELASRGYSVVGYDLSLAMLARAADEAQERGQKLNFLQGDMREMAFDEMFDGVYCWSTSFGYFDDEKNVSVLQRTHRALRQGGMLLLDVVNRDYVAPRQPSLVWFEGDGCVCMDEMHVDFFSSRLRVKRTAMFEDGRSRELDYSIRLYALHELGKMLHDCGFKVVEVTGHPAHPGVFFGSESPRIIVLAERS